MGPAGAGKGTMSEKITDKYGIPHIYSGDMFRAEIAGKTPLGLKAKAYIDAGELVPDDITIGMVEKRIQQPDCQKGYLLDGFPRTLNQAKALSELTKRLGIPLEIILDLRVDFDELSRRVTGRRTCPKCQTIYNIYTLPSKVAGVCDNDGTKLVQRTDDTEDGLRERLKEYEKQTVPVLEHFKAEGLARVIDAGKDIDEVWAQVEKVLEGYKK